MMIKKEVRFECKLLEQKKIPHDDKVNQIYAVFSVCLSPSSLVLSLLALVPRQVVWKSLMTLEKFGKLRSSDPFTFLLPRKKIERLRKPHGHSLHGDHSTIH